MEAILQYVLYLLILVALAIPLGGYIAKVMKGDKVFLSCICRPCERLIYKVLRVDEKEEMTWKKYALSTILFSGIGLVIFFAIEMLQQILPLNPEKLPGLSWHLAFNTAASFVTNTNWQAYSGESALSYFTQATCLTVWNFVSAATGIAVLFVLIRGFVRKKADTLGSFWVDLTRTVVYILLPLSVVVTLVLVSQGVVQNLKPYETVSLVESFETEEGTEVTEQTVPMGPAASQIAIKQLGTNGGGFFGVNSAFPLENPTPLSNLFEMLSILLIPVSLCFTFGKAVKDKRQGYAIFVAMAIMLVAALGIIGYNEQQATPQLSAGDQVNLTTVDQAGGNMEGKETRFGIATSATWAAFTTAASNGSVNSMHDSYTPIGGMITMLQMQLGEVIFGGVGCGLYGMLAFAIMTVFIAGLMVGRTPEYLGKKIEPFEMKMAVLVCLATPVGILVGSGIAAVWPGVADSLNNAGAHGFAEMLYAYSSAGGNNGSAFAGFNANTPFLNVTIGLVMLFVRFLPMLATIAIAGSLAKKKTVATSAGTLSTCNGMFVFLLIFIVLLIGALSFLPALALGPIAEFFQMIG
ncbi:potassium-transporting ATPase subunit KdpA [Lactonifactor sp. BIOML-A3]|uniref:potassium-transporting ATPase subunit KdpA n=1 Tax=unclassified Lactonifactor TaxID=2636670 RepID=UPI0012B0C1C9|nr:MULTISPECIES: potassium-transporting ATPase subunit KdpA [unclassified Lactonifactor]MSA04103.1 potassium-transporting ATPase subunit KdpA [Lactonifactor sp. BIOML-A5]MSA10730.1 potassium-transporting ATPase subunit KdpA [Lactonifactor sp. BIOML-A4]MSA13611.1 potassium-transporting ATPase subunit KdpA [Lactonifactor sp. BIOML-A3]MSA19667.1 potassium-transporting ATPase subunit KdpA [Lactonifactor sp. BIOML-A2]MSA40284.1 potassium-transporting ATPase subunit KdpA [Lactonifactor sp. BIOML-A1]